MNTNRNAIIIGLLAVGISVFVSEIAAKEQERPPKMLFNPGGRSRVQ